jgi:predicted nucleotidyltransferase
MKKKLVIIFFILFVLIAGVFKSELNNFYVRQKVIKFDNRFEKFVENDMESEFSKIDASIKKAQKISQESRLIDYPVFKEKTKKEDLSDETIIAINNAIDSLYKIMPRLNPLVFDGEKMRDEAKRNIYNKLFYKLDFFKKNGILNENFKITDVILKGSMAGYLYHKKSDLDVAVCAKYKTPFDKQNEYNMRINLDEIYYSSLFTLFYYKQSSFYGMPVTVFLADCNFEKDSRSSIPVMTGMYSLFRDEWLVKPQKPKFAFSRKAVFDFILGYYSRFLDDFEYYKKVILGKIKANKNVCDVFDSNIDIYSEFKNSGYVYLKDEAYSFANVARKILDRLYFHDNYYSMKEHCKANLPKILSGDYKNISKTYITKDLRFGVELGSHFDLDKKGECKKTDAKMVHNLWKIKLDNFFEKNKKMLNSGLWENAKSNPNLKKTIKQEILNKVNHNKIKDFLSVHNEIVDVRLSGKAITSLDYEEAPLILYVVNKLQMTMGMSFEQTEYLKENFKLALKIKDLEFNASSWAKLGKRRIIIKSILQNEREKYPAYLNSYSLFENNHNFEIKKLDYEFSRKNIYDLGASFYEKLYEITNQLDFADRCACLGDEIYQKIQNIEAQYLQSLGALTTTESMLYELITSDEMYHDYLYDRVVCDLKKISNGDYEQYQQLFR